MKLASIPGWIGIFISSVWGKIVTLPPLLDLQGQIVPLEQNDQKRIRVLVFLGTECPIARSYLPALNRLHQDDREKKIDLFGIWSDSTVTRAEAANHFKEFGVTFPILNDNGGLLSPTHLPEVFVFDPLGHLAYRGAIDNTWKEVGRRRPLAEKQFLNDTIEALLAGEKPPLAETQAVGCIFESPVAHAEGPTFTRDIPLLIYTRTTSYTLPRDVIMVGAVPHMHLLGKSMKAVATLPDKTQHTLINVPRWNYNWQDEYYYERPFTLPKGTRIQLTASFDNSDDNPSNPSHPPKRVTWGEGTLDEMLYCFFLISAPKTEDVIHTIFHAMAHDAKQPRK